MVFAIPDDQEGPTSINSSWPRGSTPGKSWVARSLPIMVTWARLWSSPSEM